MNTSIERGGTAGEDRERERIRREHQARVRNDMENLDRNRKRSLVPLWTGAAFLVVGGIITAWELLCSLLFAILRGLAVAFQSAPGLSVGLKRAGGAVVRYSALSVLAPSGRFIASAGLLMFLPALIAMAMALVAAIILAYAKRVVPSNSPALRRPNRYKRLVLTELLVAGVVLVAAVVGIMLLLAMR